MINLKLNYPSVDAEAVVLEHYLTHLADCRDLNSLLNFPPYEGAESILRVAAKWLKLKPDVFPEIVSVAACNSANQALNCILGALKRIYSTVLVEPFSYPAFKTLSHSHGYSLRSCDFDNEGLTVAGIEQAVAETNGKLVYLQPTIHNPTCAVMSAARRRQIAKLAHEKDLLLIEDDAYRFLHPDPPPSFLDLIPERTIHIASLSKPYNPLVKTAFIVMPAGLTNAITDFIRITSSGNSSLLCDFANYILQHNVLPPIVTAKQVVACERQKIAQKIFAPETYKAFGSCFHLWITLPHNKIASHLVNQLAALGVSISSGVDFTTVKDESGEQYIRLSLGAEKDVRKIEKGLALVASLL